MKNNNIDYLLFQVANNITLAIPLKISWSAPQQAHADDAINTTPRQRARFDVALFCDILVLMTYELLNKCMFIIGSRY